MTLTPVTLMVPTGNRVDSASSMRDAAWLEGVGSA